MSLTPPSQSPDNSDSSQESSFLNPPSPRRRAADRKPRKTVTKEKVESIVRQLRREHPPSFKEIAQSLDLSYSTVKGVVRKIRDGRFGDYDNIHFVPVKLGRRSKVTPDIAERVKALLTEATTATLRSVQETLRRENVNVGTTTLWMIAHNEQLSVQRLSFKSENVFTQDLFRARFEYATQIENVGDDELWFVDECGFNLHVAPIRCWSVVGRTPIETVPRNRKRNCPF